MTRPPPRSTLFPYTTLSRSKQTVAAVTGKNHQFLFLPVLLNQYPVDADPQQLDIAKRITFFHKPGLAGGRSKKCDIAGDAHQPHRQRMNHRPKNFAVNDPAYPRLDRRRQIRAAFSG